MTPSQKQVSIVRLGDAAKPGEEKILGGQSLAAGIGPDSIVLIVLAAGRGTRFGQAPKCIQPVGGRPLARHSIEEFHRFSAAPAICLVGHRHEEVAAALGSGNIYVQSDNPTGGTAFAAREALAVPELLASNPLLLITMGDRIVPSAVFRRLADRHRAGGREAELTFLTAIYEPPKNRGKGRVLRDQNQRVLRICEEKDILAEQDEAARQALLDLTEGNCPLYAIRAAALERYSRDLTNANAQNQYYLTDIVEAISRAGEVVRTIVTRPEDPEYDLLCSDVTRPMDLALLEGILASSRGLLFPEELQIEEAARAIAAGRPPAQVLSIARQLGDLIAAVRREKLSFEPDRPVAIGISGGRLRLAFMHPDMARFYGPAWQMPIGAGRPDGDEQIVMLVQAGGDQRIHLYPIEPRYRESVNFVAADHDALYPGEHICDLHAYEEFGTRLSETLLLSLGYFSDDELAARRANGRPLPPPSLWVNSNLRRPFALVDNAIASLRTLRAGHLGATVQRHLGRGNFTGLRIVSTGNVPQGGFSSSSAVTVATENAINALYELGIPSDLLVHLACQAEYGTGVRAGSLDQATEQNGRAGLGTLISSNPRDNYRTLGTFPFPAGRIQILFPYSVERDRAAWRWSWGAYAETAPGHALTAAEMRKMTGKAAELAAVLLRLPLDMDFFKQIEDDLLPDGLLSPASSACIASLLRRVPLLATREELRRELEASRDWYACQIANATGIDSRSAAEKADLAFASLFAGWRDPVLRRTTAAGTVVEERGVPLRAMLAYLFGEVAKNFYLIHNPERWIEYVTLSQRGDCCAEIDASRLPSRDAMQRGLDWERGIAGPALLDAWLERAGATPFDFNRGLDDASLAAPNPPDFHRLEGSNFFRGLALIDFAGAMLKRAFGDDAVAVRVNAAGQGDYFQVHVDKSKADPDNVKQFLRAAFYRRFGLSPDPEFVEVFPGGGAAAVRLSRFEALPQLIQRLQAPR